MSRADFYAMAFDEMMAALDGARRRDEREEDLANVVRTAFAEPYDFGRARAAAAPPPPLAEGAMDAFFDRVNRPGAIVWHTPGTD